MVSTSERVDPHRCSAPFRGKLWKEPCGDGPKALRSEGRPESDWASDGRSLSAIRKSRQEVAERNDRIHRESAGQP